MAHGWCYSKGIEAITIESTMAFGSELSIGQRAADWRVLLRSDHKCGQHATILPRCLLHLLSQDQLRIHIRHDQPLQLVYSRALGPAGVLLQPKKVGAYRVPCRSCGIDGYRGSLSLPPKHAPHHIVLGAIYVVGCSSGKEKVRWSVVGKRSKLQDRTQLGVFAKPHLNFGKI
jgi:hypothetical protein